MCKPIVSHGCLHKQHTYKTDVNNITSHIYTYISCKTDSKPPKLNAAPAKAAHLFSQNRCHQFVTTNEAPMRSGISNHSNGPRPKWVASPRKPMATSCHYRFPPTLILKSSLSREASKKHMFEETMIVETEGLQ